MKKLNITRRFIALFMILSMVALFTSCSCSLCGISLCSAEPEIDEELGYTNQSMDEEETGYTECEEIMHGDEF